MECYQGKIPTYNGVFCLFVFAFKSVLILDSYMNKCQGFSRQYFQKDFDLVFCFLGLQGCDWLKVNQLASMCKAGLELNILCS